MAKLTNKVVVITGASSGIGKEIAIAAARSDASLVLLGRNSACLASVRKKCLTYTTGDVIYYSLDLLEPDQMDLVLEKIFKQTPKIDVLVNNAGVGLTENFLTNDFTEINKLVQVNVLSLVYLTQKFAIEMLKYREGHIVNIASMAGKVPSQKTAVYSASKSFVITFSDVIRLELRTVGINVTTVNLGPVDTPFFNEASQGYLKKVKPFLLEANYVGQKIVNTFLSQKREVNLPHILNFASKFYQISPRLGDFILSTFFRK